MKSRLFGLVVTTTIVIAAPASALTASISTHACSSRYACILATIGLETGTGPDEDAMDLEEPFEPRWRAGRLSIGYEEDSDQFLLEIEEFQPELEEDDPLLLLQEEAELLRLWASREQMFALSRHAATVVDRGRPTCQFCGNPLDPEGHACPAMNGHSKRT